MLSSWKPAAETTVRPIVNKRLPPPTNFRSVALTSVTIGKVPLQEPIGPVSVWKEVLIITTVTVHHQPPVEAASAQKPLLTTADPHSCQALHSHLGSTLQGFMVSYHSC